MSAVIYQLQKKKEKLQENFFDCGNSRKRSNVMSTEIKIPAENITRQYQQIKVDVENAIEHILPTGIYTLGPNVKAFEDEFAAYCQTQYSIGISNGTEALHLALTACGIGPGDEVITVPNTYIATVFAISYVGAQPVFVDVDPSTFNLDVKLIEEKVTPRTKAILPVHLYGQCVDMDPLMEIAEKYHLWVIEDAAHAHGAEYKGRKAGSLSHIGCFSFYPTKVLGAFGDGGIVTTSDGALYDKIRVLRYMGQHKKYLHEIIGFQQRLGEIQAAVLRVKLHHLDAWIKRRNEIANLYSEYLTGLPIKTPFVAEGMRHAYYMYTILSPYRDELSQFLADHGIGSQVMYPLEVPYQPAYQHLGHTYGDFPNADAHVKELLCLPMFPELTNQEVLQVSNAIHSFFDNRI
jgi:dTDP-4-amino-4,6-dideoxygalactose transaminase